MQAAMDLSGTWLVYRTAAGAIAEPGGGDVFDSLVGVEAVVPGSLYSVLGNVVGQESDLESSDWWYCCDFDYDGVQQPGAGELIFERLATLAEIWLNGTLIGSSANFFQTLRIPLTSELLDSNRLIICFRALNKVLGQRMPRPRWKTGLVSQQNLRWIRTPLLGRIPGWTQPTPALGPCGRITLRAGVQLVESSVSLHYSDGNGVVNARVRIAGEVNAVTLMVGDSRVSMNALPDAEGVWEAELILSNPVLWWPHTHGLQAGYEVSLLLSGSTGEQCLNHGKRYFRSVSTDSEPSAMCWRVNGQSVFVRGACWTITDPKRFWAEQEQLRSLLTLARDGGINMLRVGGTMQYEQDEFYRICDELGIMVWQDFMFANMDYPVDDPEFHRSILVECETQLQRLSQFACVSAFCGSSEILQQAAMVGVSPDAWSNAFLDEELPALVERYCGSLPYFASTPCGGVMPFHLGTGITHFYGVGAYKLPVLGSGADVVRFTAETMGFSNVPDTKAVEAMFGGALPACHHPEWKRGIPRDAGAGWDFEDIRDYYLQALFKVDPVALRSRDTNRYLALSRQVPGELIKQVYGRWRRPGSVCGGGLLWFYKDLVPGAGWGMIDSAGSPKPLYYQIKRSFHPVAAFINDNGLDGLEALVVNDTPEQLSVEIQIKVISVPDTVSTQCVMQIGITSGGCWQSSIDALLDGFRDLNYRYQFGARQHDLVSLQVFNSGTHELLCDDVYFAETMALPLEHCADISCESSLEGERYFLNISSNCFLQSVIPEISKCDVSDKGFHLVPGVARRIEVFPHTDNVGEMKGSISALNLADPVRIRVLVDKGCVQ